MNPKNLRRGEFVVEFKIVKRIRVRDTQDEITAEREAFQQLPECDKRHVTDTRMIAGKYEDGAEYQGTDWYPTDIDFLFG